MIYLYSDLINRSGGIETYLHALALKLDAEGIPFRVAVTEGVDCPLLDELEARGIDVYRQPRVPGDRWRVRHHILMAWLWWHLEPGDWVFCVRQPLPDLYLRLVRLVHHRGAQLAASWMLAPEFLPPEPPHGEGFCRAVDETDAVVSVSECTKDQFAEVYGYDGLVHVARYHNLPFFDAPMPLPEGPPWKIGFMGRLHVKQKNLDTLLQALDRLVKREPDVELHFHGEGGDRAALEALTHHLGLTDRVFFHGGYDHRHDLPEVMANCHLFVYTSRYEGGPCFTLLELLQAGRYVVAAPVGGIPDIYAGRPDAGLLVEPDDPAVIAGALGEALERIRTGKVDPARVRARYFEEFDMEAAHEGWRAALQLSCPGRASGPQETPIR